LTVETGGSWTTPAGTPASGLALAAGGGAEAEDGEDDEEQEAAASASASAPQISAHRVTRGFMKTPFRCDSQKVGEMRLAPFEEG
jgi:hypothetical protein